MKKILSLILLLFNVFLTRSQVCPSLTTTTGSVNCLSPCTTLTVTPSVINATNTYSVVVNRFGQTVFETISVNKGWNGTFNGVPQDLGVYFYFVSYECDGKLLEKKGDVTLIR